MGSDGRRRRRPGAADGRRPGRARRLALGVPDQPAVRRARHRGHASYGRGEPGTGPPRHAGHPGCAAAGGRPGAAEPGHHQGQRLGLEQPPRPRLVPARRPPHRVVRAELAAPPCAGRRPGAHAHRVLPDGECRDRPGGPRLLRLPADQHPVAPVRVGVRRPACGPGAGAGRAGGCGGGRPARTARRAGGVPGPGRPRRAGVGRRLPLVPPDGRPRAGLLGRVAAGPGPVGHRGGRHPAAARQRSPRRGARGSVRDGVGPRLQRPPARRRAGRLDPRPDRGQPHRPGRRGRPPGRLDAVDRRVRPRRARRAADRQGGGPLGRRGRRARLAAAAAARGRVPRARTAPDRVVDRPGRHPARGRALRGCPRRPGRGQRPARPGRGGVAGP